MLVTSSIMVMYYIFTQTAVIKNWRQLTSMIYQCVHKNKIQIQQRQGIKINNLTTAKFAHLYMQTIHATSMNLLGPPTKDVGEITCLSGILSGGILSVIRLKCVQCI